MTNNELDKLVAERIGVIVPRGSRHFFLNGKRHGYTWTLQDARCREIAREYFGIDTEYDEQEKSWMAAAKAKCFVFGHGKTIAEAEIACIRAIMEAE